MKQFLIATQTTSDEHPAAGGRYSGTIFLTDHAGGTWTLQAESPDGDWVDTNVTFTADGIQSNIIFEQGISYRLNGGSAGAKAWVSEFA